MELCERGVVAFASVLTIFGLSLLPLPVPMGALIFATGLTLLVLAQRSRAASAVKLLRMRSRWLDGGFRFRKEVPGLDHDDPVADAPLKPLLDFKAKAPSRRHHPAATGRERRRNYAASNSLASRRAGRSSSLPVAGSCRRHRRRAAFQLQGQKARPIHRTRQIERARQVRPETELA